MLLFDKISQQHNYLFSKVKQQNFDEHQSTSSKILKEKRLKIVSQKLKDYKIVLYYKDR